MREILFRGKNVYGEWVEGFYYKAKLNRYDKELCDYLTKPYPETEGKPSDHVFVYPETIGQYTGLTDKNGKKIFEGDILKGEQYPYKDGDGDYNYFAEVVWFDNSPAFGLYTFKNPKSNVRGISTGNTSYIEDFASEYWEVIGNIHDNPELLTEAETT